MKSFHKLTIILLLIPTLTFGIGKTHKKSKKIAKSFTVNSDATLSIDNKYGDINITTWAKNTIEIDVEITIKGDDVGDVENQLEKIDIEFNDSPNLLEVKTIFKKNKSSWSWWGKSKKVSYKIIYIFWCKHLIKYIIIIIL